MWPAHSHTMCMCVCVCVPVMLTLHLFDVSLPHQRHLANISPERRWLVTRAMLEQLNSSSSNSPSSALQICPFIRSISKRMFNFSLDCYAAQYLLSLSPSWHISLRISRLYSLKKYDSLRLDICLCRPWLSCLSDCRR